MKRIILLIMVVSIFISCTKKSSRIYLDEMDLKTMEIGWGEVQVNRSVEGNPLTVAGKEFQRGVGTHAVSKMLLSLSGKALSFHGYVGVDDESTGSATLEFFVLGDARILWQSGIMTKGDTAREVTLDLQGIQKLGLYVWDGGDNNYWDHANWMDTWIEYRKAAPQAVACPAPEAYILTPPVPDSPRINGPTVYGAHPGHPFLFKIPASGKKPILFSASGLPDGLTMDTGKGIITGSCLQAGDFSVMIKAANELGQDEKILMIKIGDTICLTPPMGWNSWNCWGLSVDQDKVKAAIDAMVSSGLADHGWCYINIDDGWEAAERAPSGELPANDKFPGMKALADHAHSQGLKLGIYSSPGTYTCGGFLGSCDYEQQDAETWADWGIDYLKYDWCSYEKIAADHSLPELKKPYLKMLQALKEIDRDIVYSLCQYGMGDVWTWGQEAGGNLWRTTGDINDTWNSMAGIGFGQDAYAPYARPGSWNDPDMLVVGNVGWGPSLHKTRLTPDEQYTHISLWCLLSAPLLLGCDLSQLDAFTMNLLTNDEVLAVNQDPSGMQARKVRDIEGKQVWVKHLYDGSLAVGFFNTGNDSPQEAFQWTEHVAPDTVSVTWDDLNITGQRKVRDLWRQKDLGVYDRELHFPVNKHGVVLVRLSD